MTTQRIHTALAAIFKEAPLVFWHDTDSEFAAVIDSLHLEGVTLLRLDETPALRIKLLLEASLDQRWLLYSNQPEPEPAKDRVDRLKKLVLPGDGASDLDNKMLAVLTRADQPELFAKFQTGFYSDPVDAVFKALGVE